LIGFTPINEQVSISDEMRVVGKYFLISNCFGVVAAAIYGDVDCVD
jgi:hypothetical protein